MKIIKVLAIIILTVTLVATFTPIFGNLYEKIFGQVSSGFFWGPSHPEYVNGFFMGYALFVSIAIFIFGQKRKLLLSLIFIGLFVLLDLWIGPLRDTLFDLGLIVFAFLLAQGILATKRKFSK